MLLGGTFGKPISLEQQQANALAQENSGADQKELQPQYIAVSGDGYGFDRSSRSPSPRTHDEKFPVLESNKGSVFAEEEQKFDHLSKLVSRV